MGVLEKSVTSLTTRYFGHGIFRTGIIRVWVIAVTACVGESMPKEVNNGGRIGGDGTVAALL